MQDLLEYIVKSLVTNPEAVIIEESNDGGNVNLLLTVAPEDMGLIIGKGGQTIHSIRKLLTVRAIAENVRVNLQLVDNGPKPAGKEKESSEKKEEVVEEKEVEEVSDKQKLN